MVRDESRTAAPKVGDVVIALNAKRYRVHLTRECGGIKDGYVVARSILTDGNQGRAVYLQIARLAVEKA